MFLQEFEQKKGIEKRFFDLCSQVVSENNLELYDLEYLPGGQTLRVYIRDLKTGSAQIDDCVKIDKALSPYFDELEWIPQGLILEVSSPGIYRALKTISHLEGAIGENVCLQLKKKIKELREEKEWATQIKKLAGDKKIIGKLTRLGNEELELKLEGYELDLVISFNDIKKANIEATIDF